MKIGVILSNIARMDVSLVHIYESTIESLQQEHELIYRPPDYAFHSEAWQKDALRDMLFSCDVLLGMVAEAGLVLQVRQDINKQIPYVCFMDGWLSRGNTTIMSNHHLFRTTDVLVVNCTS